MSVLGKTRVITIQTEVTTFHRDLATPSSCGVEAGQVTYTTNTPAIKMAHRSRLQLKPVPQAVQANLQAESYGSNVCSGDWSRTG